jgi:hypothetical protein
MSDMPSAEDPRITLRLGSVDHAVLERYASSCGVELGALVREAALRGAASVARDVLAGDLRLRRRRSGASSEVEKSEAEEASVSGAVVPASPRVSVGVARAAAVRRAVGRV